MKIYIFYGYNIRNAKNEFNYQNKSWNDYWKFIYFMVTTSGMQRMSSIIKINLEMIIENLYILWLQHQECKEWVQLSK